MDDNPKPPMWENCESIDDHWDYVKRYREFFQNPSDYDYGCSLEQQWERIESYQRQIQMYEHFPREPKEVPEPAKPFRKSIGLIDDTPIEFFLRRWGEGLYPPPEILESIANTFRTYFIYRGSLSLEQAFFGAPQKGSGTYAKRCFSSSTAIFSSFELFLLARNKKNENLTLEASAESFLKQRDEAAYMADESEPTSHSIDIDSFLRGYRRFKASLKN